MQMILIFMDLHEREVEKVKFKYSSFAEVHIDEDNQMFNKLHSHDRKSYRIVNEKALKEIQAVLEKNSDLEKLKIFGKVEIPCERPKGFPKIYPHLEKKSALPIAINIPEVLGKLSQVLAGLEKNRKKAELKKKNDIILGLYESLKEKGVNPTDIDEISVIERLLKENNLPPLGD